MIKSIHLKEAVQTSYQKGGISVCISDEFVSKETMKNKIHALEFPKNTEVQMGHGRLNI